MLSISRCRIQQCIARRCLMSDIKISDKLRYIYKKSREECSLAQTSQRVNPRAVFVNNEVDLHKIGVYGFDYDYTLAVYTRSLNELIYNAAMNNLVNKLKYPTELLDIPYDVSFSIRGLHYDIENSCLLKVDAFNQIQKGTVYRGKRSLSEDSIKKMYGGFTLPNMKGRSLYQLIDLFSLPWAGLLATVVEYLDNKSFVFDPTGLYNDVASSVQDVHISGEMYRLVMEDMERYIHKNVGLYNFLERVTKDGKELFIATNSPFTFMNAGMTYMLGPDWRKFFKYVMVSTKKPGFFQGNAPFRLYNENTDSVSFERVDELEQGKIYSGGNIREFCAKSSFQREGVMYFGDHIYSDLAEPMLQIGWRTAAIVPELAREIRTQNTDKYRLRVLWLETLSRLIEQHQKYGKHDVKAEEVIRGWAEERRRLRIDLKCMFNAQFGSMFRTFHNPTFFCRRLNRLSDIYTSRLPNLLQYDDDHTFFPRRNALAHEPHLPEPEMADIILEHVSNIRIDPKSGRSSMED
ncbi:unnamed protein product [Bursaphelenchus okinawaensis]|uniref:5'-nucleotidase domain-containing protein 3 n=1 Tax=Bursaphelenchus okinawaensis TaxID=465554 RepID=A0A811KV48_9BILA|nr:unnamed protein product [Bursaphelenchus okinawaensis]CAG9112770.1 unnamed protein product [Bursaphelenchus okinawaensis]